MKKSSDRWRIAGSGRMREVENYNDVVNARAGRSGRVLAVKRPAT